MSKSPWLFKSQKEPCSSFTHSLRVCNGGLDWKGGSYFNTKALYHTKYRSVYIPYKNVWSDIPYKHIGAAIPYKLIGVGIHTNV